MAIKKRGLGKGLNELLSATLESPEKQIDDAHQKLVYLPAEKLMRGAFQPRQEIRHEGLEQLSESIKTQGIVQPIVVRKKGDGYEIIAGERRWRAAQLAGLETVPVIIREIPDEAAMVIALIENIQRENLNAIEEAHALKRIADELKLTHLQLAESVGKSRASITNILRLLSLNEEVQALLREEKIEMGHARALLSLKGPAQTQMAQTVIARALSVRETERLISKQQEGDSYEPETSYKVTLDPNIRRLEEDLAGKLGANVRIRHADSGQGQLVIRYHSVDELEGILAHLK